MKINYYYSNISFIEQFGTKNDKQVIQLCKIKNHSNEIIRLILILIHVGLNHIKGNFKIIKWYISEEEYSNQFIQKLLTII